ncbi:unnamed protein product [Symbiodinium natans]|uniref:Uncharacterized protein n=1 Tax=Symbiodinium natans TaxID=878477 RepID=A0A812NK91_9DINO|nr:unnamed protein product [Symbiodinium natans]
MAEQEHAHLAIILASSLRGRVSCPVPAAYAAFKEQAVRMSSAGAEIGLSKGMCQDRHVNDFLMCFQCWLWRTFGDPRSTGQPWRLRRLDLSRNNLTDESVCAVLDSMKQLDLRVDRVLLSGNRLRGSGLASVTEYIWNCRDPLIELDLADNEIHGEPGEQDGFSGLLRCLYNHPSYPMMQEHRKAAPLQLRMSGNYIRDAQRLLDDILANGCKDGKALIRLCPNADPYVQDHEEFLSVFLPDFMQQRGADGQLPSHGGANGQDATTTPITLRSRSRKRRRRKLEAEAAAAAKAPAPAPVEATPAPAADGHRSRRRKEKHKEQPNTAAAPPTKEPPPAATAQAPVISEEEQKKLQAEVGKKLAKLEELSSDQSTCDMLSEFTVCMLVARKPPTEVETELASFLGQEYAQAVATWFVKHVRHHYKPAAKLAGWK